MFRSKVFQELPFCQPESRSGMISGRILFHSYILYRDFRPEDLRRSIPGRKSCAGMRPSNNSHKAFPQRLFHTGCRLPERFRSRLLRGSNGRRGPSDGRRPIASRKPREKAERPSSKKAPAGSLQEEAEGRGASDQVYIKPGLKQPNGRSCTLFRAILGAKTTIFDFFWFLQQFP